MAKIVLDGVAREVEVHCGPDGVVVVVDGRRHNVSEIQVTSGTVAFLVDRASYLAHASHGPAGRIVSLGALVGRALVVCGSPSSAGFY